LSERKHLVAIIIFLEKIGSPQYRAWLGERERTREVIRAEEAK
jgi:hypothetical protein